MSVVIGIDPHKGSHAAAAVNGDDQAVAELEVKASKRQTRELLAWAERFPARRWAVESANGHGYLLAQQLVAAGEHVVDVPSTLASRARVLDSTRSQKNDANDARSVAIVALHQSCLAVSVVVAGCTGTQASPPTTSGPSSTTVEPADASPSSIPNDTSPPTVMEGEPDGWRELAEWPLERRSDFPQIWTGDELVIWGGLQKDTPKAFDDGARHNLATDTWMVLSDSPLSARSRHLGVWTGTEVIYWGGIRGDGDEPEVIDPIADGAAYDPESDSWRLLPDGPLDGGNPYAAAWTGSEVIYVGPDPSEVASYDPVADSWTELTPRPPRDRPTFWITAHWTGSELVVVASDDQQVDTVTYDADSDSWRELPRPFDDIEMPVTRGSPTHIWDGSTLWLLTFAPQETGVAGLDLDTGQWIFSPEFPGQDCTDIPTGISIGLGLLVDSCGLTAVLSGGQWSTIPSIPRFSPKQPGPPTVWTGEEILIFDAGIAPGSANFPDGSTPQFWLLEP